jgi:hypothetical protein
MRFRAPSRSAVDPVVFTRPPLAQWMEFGDLLRGPEWPAIAELNALLEDPHDPMPVSRRCFVEQTPKLLLDGLHYEQRIADRGEIATRPGNWHDLLNALVWLRFGRIKAALNARQVAEVAVAGPKQRTRAQCALTHFDEAGVVVVLRDPMLLPLWDAHDWHGLFWKQRAAWTDGRIESVLFGHALLEHALRDGQLLVGKALVVAGSPIERRHAADSVAAELDAVAAAIASAELLADPQELRPLPLSGIPGWHVDNGAEAFYREAPCFCPLRDGRRYPPVFSPRATATIGAPGSARLPRGDRTIVQAG